MRSMEESGIESHLDYFNSCVLMSSVRKIGSSLACPTKRLPKTRSSLQKRREQSRKRQRVAALAESRCLQTRAALPRTLSLRQHSRVRESCHMYKEGFGTPHLAHSGRMRHGWRWHYSWQDATGTTSKR